MQIERLKAEDLPALAKLYTQFWGEDSSVSKMAETFSRLSSNPAYIFLTAKKKGCLLGSVMGIICEELYGKCLPFLLIEDVIVDQDHRRLGIASSLMRTIEKEANARGCNFILLVTETERIGARRFYEAMGYEEGTHKGFKKRISVFNHNLD